MTKFILGLFVSSFMFSCANASTAPISQDAENTSIQQNVEEKKDDMTFSTKAYYCASYGYKYVWSDMKRYRISYCKEYKYYLPRSKDSTGGVRG